MKKRFTMLTLVALIIIMIVYFVGVVPKYNNFYTTTVVAKEKDKQQDYMDIKENKHSAKKMINKKISEIENNKEFWDYLQQKHTQTYTLLQSIKQKYPKEYKRLLLSSSNAYKRIKFSDNQQIKDILDSQIDNFTNLTKVFIDFKEKKLNDKDFENIATNYLSSIHDNIVKIMELRLKDFKNKKQEFINKAIEKAKKDREAFYQNDVDMDESK
jgi:hypothetical protein